MDRAIDSSTQPARPERRVAINSGLLLLAFGFQALVSLVLVAIVARYLGQAGLGRYGFVISFIELFIAFIDLGMNRILVREIAKDQPNADRLASSIWTLRLLLALIMLGVVAFVARGAGGQGLWLAIMVYYLSQVVFILSDVFNSVFHGFQRMEYQFWAVTGSQVALLLLTLGVVWLDLGLVALFGARLVANGLKLLFVWWTSRRRFARVHVMWGIIPSTLVALRSLPADLVILRRQGRTRAEAYIEAKGRWLGQRWQDARLIWHMFVESVPVGISLILRSYIWRAGVVLTVVWLGQQQGDLANGLLYGPLRVVQQMRIVPAAFSASMLPVLSNRAAGRMDEFDSAFAKSIKLFVAISLLISLAFTFLADPMVVLLLGGGIDLAGAAQILAILGWVIVLYFPNWLYGVALVALGRQSMETVGLALGLAAAYLVARWGIPQYQALGVAYSIMAAEAVFFIIGTAALWKHFRWRSVGTSMLKIVSACLAAGTVFFAGNLVWQQQIVATTDINGTLLAIAELALLGSLGLVVFVGSLWVLKAFDEEELEGIRAMLRLRRRDT